MAIDYEHIGARIKYFRKKAHLSQEKLAELTELSRVFISFAERGEKTPSLESIVSIANALNVSADDLLFGNLIVSNSPHDAPEYELLVDCTPEETDIILKCMAHLKEQLRGYRITKQKKGPSSRIRTPATPGCVCDWQASAVFHIKRDIRRV